MMKSSIHLLLACSFVLLSMAVQGQGNDLRIGEWKAIIPYNYGDQVTQDDNQIYYASNLGLIIIDKDNLFDRRRLSRVDGLSDTDILFCIYEEVSESLVLIYESLVIDIIGPNGIRSNLDLKNYNFTQGVKVVNSVSTDTNGGILISGNFGLSRFDVIKEEFTFNARKTDLEVYDATVWNNHYYTSTSEGIFFTQIDDINLDNFTTWTYLEHTDIPTEYESFCVVEFNNELYFGADHHVFKYDGSNFTIELTDEIYFPLYLNSDYGQLLTHLGCPGDYCEGPLFRKEVGQVFEDISQDAQNCFGQHNTAIADQSGRIWLGDGFDNFRYLRLEEGAYTCSNLFSSTIPGSGVFDIELNEDELWVAGGGYDVNYDYLFNNTGLMGYTGNSWAEYPNNNYPNIPELLDITCVEVHPETKDVYFGSYLDGLVHFDRTQDVMTYYDDSNSSLNNIAGDPTRTRVADIAFDDSLNLWIANFGGEQPISVLTNDGQWANFTAPALNLNKVTIDANGYKWFVAAGGQSGVIVYDSGLLPLDPSDDRIKVLTSNNSNLPTNNVNCVVVDKEGDVWVGTQEGPIVFDCSSLIFEDQGCQGSLRIGETDNIGAYLLETENINCIGIDGANRKWFGTDNGVFIQSPSGEEGVFNLNIDNSPLFSNSVKAISFDPNTGEAYIGTSKGILVYRGEAVDGEVYHQQLEVFPNPVRPDYEGPIAIRGLAENSRIKITTIDGKLVYELDALGGQAVWDGRDLNGNRPETGVYLIFATSDANFNKPTTATGKFMFIK